MAPADEATLISEADPSQDVPQPADSDPTPEQDPPDEDWKAKYARLRKDYDTKAARLKEVEKVVTPEPVKATVEDETDFKIENAGRIKLVKDDYKKHLAELQAEGAKLTPKLMEKALRLAESDKGISASQSEVLRQASTASAPSVVNREVSSLDDVQLTESDVRLNVKPETKQKWKHLVEGQG